MNLPKSSFLLARNWDRFGGRASEILNSFYLSQRLDLDFRFTWPSESRFPEMDEMIRVFSPDFLEKYLVTDSELENIDIVKVSLDGKLSKEEFLKLFDETDKKRRAVVLTNFFEIPKLKGDSPKESLEKFSSSISGVWSDSVLQIQSEIARKYRGALIIHARYGDLVTGNWKNFVEPTKHITGHQIYSVAKKCEEQNQKLALVTDSPEINKCFPAIEHDPDDYPGISRELGEENYRTLIDLFKIQYSHKVFAPIASAFSTLGAHLGGKEVTQVSQNSINSKSKLGKLAKSESIWTNLEPSQGGQFFSRDLDKELNSLKGIYSKKYFKKVAETAHRADTENPVAGSHLAIANALIGNWTKSELLLLSARNIANKVAGIHEDPKTFSLVAEFTCELMSVVRKHSVPVDNKSTMKDSVSRLREIESELAETKPFQINNEVAVSAISAIVGLVDLISEMRFASFRFTLVRIILHNITKRDFRYSEERLFVLNLIQSIRLEVQESRAMKRKFF